MKIAMIGAGYVGLTTGTCLAQLDHTVNCYDVDQRRIERLSKGELPIYEPGLRSAMRRAADAGRLLFSPALEECVREADAVFLAVGTPSRRDGQIDLSFIEDAAVQIAPHLKTGAVVVIKSTVVVGTCQRVRELIARRRLNADFSVASNPEFLREGSAMNDFMKPDRIVIGADDPRAEALLKEIYEPLSQRGFPVLATTTHNAELIKYAANAFLALKIGFINDVADLCEQVGGDVLSVAEGIGLDQRIGSSFLAPGPGFGGSCFPKDTRAFIATGREHGAAQALIEALVVNNEDRKHRLARRVLAEAELSPGSTVAILGLAFKANTDDLRESAALAMISALREAGVSIVAHDPKAMVNARDLLPEIRLAATPYEAARAADAVVILTEWDEYRRLDIARLASEMAGASLFDYRNLLNPQAVAAAGLRYFGIGRPPVLPASMKQKRRRAATTYPTSIAVAAR